jgi:hypothetical protein
MTAPDRIPIMYEPGDHTGSIGTYQHGLFLGAIILAQPPMPALDGPLTPGAEHWYAALHLFDHDGRHTTSQIWDAGPHEPGSAAVADRANAHLAELVQNLPDAQRRDIAVRPFQLTQDGITFGLILDSHPDYGDWADLLPNGLRFHAPWDGEYDT